MLNLEDKIRTLLDEKKVSFAKPEEVSQAVGCEVGCVPPFGHLINTSDSYLATMIRRSRRQDRINLTFRFVSFVRFVVERAKHELSA